MPDPVASLGQLPVAIVADVLDRLNLRRQVLSGEVRPRTTGALVAGRAYTVLAEPDTEIRENPYEHELEAVDAVPPDAVLVIATGNNTKAALWGELLATRARARECRAAVLDGAVRDLAALRAMGMPTWAAAVSANDSRGRLQVVSHGLPVVCAGVAVRSGDIVMADLDGVVVVPDDRASEVVAAAREKLVKERSSRQSLLRGLSAAEVYESFGVL